MRNQYTLVSMHSIRSTLAGQPGSWMSFLTTLLKSKTATDRKGIEVNAVAESRFFDWPWILFLGIWRQMHDLSSICMPDYATSCGPSCGNVLSMSENKVAALAASVQLLAFNAAALLMVSSFAVSCQCIPTCNSPQLLLSGTLLMPTEPHNLMRMMYFQIWQSGIDMAACTRMHRMHIASSNQS